MRILYLTPGCFDMGGISRYSRYQISAWREVVGPSCVKVISLLGPDELSIEEPFTVDYAANGTSSSAKARFFKQALVEALTWRPDVIHVAHLHQSAMAKAIALMSGARSLLNIYGLEVWSAPKIDTAWGLRASDFVISDSEFTADYVKTNQLRTKGNLVVVRDCVDIAKFHPAAPTHDVVARYSIPDPSTGLNLLSLGRLTKDAAHKGYERLVQAFALIAQRAPTLRLIFAGRGDLTPSLEDQATRLGVRDRVHFTGRIHEADLADVYRSAHFFSLVGDCGPGRGEGVPLTPLEASACGLPVMVGNQDGSRETAIDGETGFVLDPFDAGRHAERILDLATDHELRLRLGQQATKRIGLEFSYVGFVERHRELLASINHSINN